MLLISLLKYFSWGISQFSLSFSVYWTSQIMKVISMSPKFPGIIPLTCVIIYSFNIGDVIFLFFSPFDMSQGRSQSMHISITPKTFELSLQQWEIWVWIIAVVHQERQIFGKEDAQMRLVWSVNLYDCVC